MKKSVVLVLMSILGVLMTTGCASTTRGKTNPITFDGVPSNAEVRLSSGHMGRTPVTLEVPKKYKHVTFTIEHEGFEPATGELKAKVSGWGVTAVASQGLASIYGIPFIVSDIITKSYREFDSNLVKYELAPIGRGGPPWRVDREDDQSRREVSSRAPHEHPNKNRPHYRDTDREEKGSHRHHHPSKEKIDEDDEDERPPTRRFERMPARSQVFKSKTK